VSEFDDTADDVDVDGAGRGDDASTCRRDGDGFVGSGDDEAAEFVDVAEVDEQLVSRDTFDEGPVRVNGTAAEAGAEDADTVGVVGGVPADVCCTVDAERTDGGLQSGEADDWVPVGECGLSGVESGRVGGRRWNLLGGP